MSRWMRQLSAQSSLTQGPTSPRAIALSRKRVTLKTPILIQGSN
jgi:hypothetical protein